MKVFTFYHTQRQISQVDVFINEPLRFDEIEKGIVRIKARDDDILGMTGDRVVRRIGMNDGRKKRCMKKTHAGEFCINATQETTSLSLSYTKPPFTMTSTQARCSCTAAS